MIVTFTKNIHGVDFGAFGKKTVQLQVKLEQRKGEWYLYCQFMYIVNSSGTLTPVDKSVSTYEWLRNEMNTMLTDVKSINDWKYD